jgi:DNA-directed RNA polymerase specialized sigma24 family protein
MKKDTIVNLGHLADNDLLLLFANGDVGAARILAKRLMPKIFRYAYHRIYNRADAEDITQEAFMRLWKISPNWQQQ